MRPTNEARKMAARTPMARATTVSIIVPNTIGASDGAHAQTESETWYET